MMDHTKVLRERISKLEEDIEALTLGFEEETHLAVEGISVTMSGYGAVRNHPASRHAVSVEVSFDRS